MRKKLLLLLLVVALGVALLTACRAGAGQSVGKSPEKHSEPTEQISEPTTEATTDATESTSASTEPTAAPTEQTTDDTENTSAPTEPTVVPTEPTECSHTFGEWVVTKQANCKDAGERTRTCTKCAAAEKEDTAKSDTHTPVTDAAIPATCKTTGLTEGSHCSVCKLVFVEQNFIPKTEHIFVDNLCACGTYQDSEGLTFAKYGSGYAVTGIGTCQDARIVVPATYNGLPVKSVAADAFKSKNSFYEIVLPASVTSIGARAFAYCKGLKTIAIPDGVEYLEIETFAECTALETVKLPSQLLQIMERCFVNCRSLKQIELPKKIIKIREFAFCDCRALKEIALPSSLNEIQQFAFYDCTSLSIQYLGMRWQFKSLTKGFEWCGNIWSGSISCIDGDCDFAGNAVDW